MLYSKLALFTLAARFAAVAALEGESLTFSGQMTFYDPNEVWIESGKSGTPFSACGTEYREGDALVAINSAQFTKGHCGGWIWIKYGNREARARIWDLCPECPANNIDVTENVFSELAPLGAGRVGLGSDTNKPLTWRFETVDVPNQPTTPTVSTMPTTASSPEMDTLVQSTSTPSQAMYNTSVHKPTACGPYQDGFYTPKTYSDGVY